MDKKPFKIKTPDFKKLKNVKKPANPSALTKHNKFVDFVKNPKTLNIASAVVITLMHVLFVLAVVLAYRYFAIYPSLVMSLLGILVCVIVAIDVVYLIGFKHKDKVMKIISVVLAFLIFVASSVGTYYVGKVNTAVSSVIGTTIANDANYEEVSGVFVCRNEDASSMTDLSSISGKSVGYVTETGKGVSTIGLDLLDSNNIKYTAHVYTSYDELLIDLSDDNIDVAIFLDGYRGLYSRNAEEGNADYTGIITEFTDFYSFSDKVEVEKSKSTKDISKDPFNVLLIGYSRTEIGSSIGLADAIIVASVNPQTYTVSMMSIARDSYVPISCYGGTKDKINSARGTSRACFIQTVEDYTGMTMDYYMEADYEAVVDVVDALEGIVITNPVDFTLDGVDVPAGTYNAWGWQVLEFCRERHHMPNGDFDRQQHQKEVIIAIAEKLLKKADITLFLNAIEAAGDKFSTNLTLNQLTSMFNMLLNTKNYTGLKISKLIDFNQLRLTGYSDWYYNYSMSLPLWIYKIYQGSYDESIEHARYVLGEIDETANQTYSFTYDKNTGYDRPLFYSLTYDEEEVHEEIPAYYPNFVGYSYADVLNMASESGYNLNFKFISSDSASYVESQDGYVVAQSLRYGTLCSAGANTLTIMGDGVVKIKFPDYGDWSLEDAKDWCKEKGYDYSTKEEFTNDSTKKNKIANMEQDDKSVVITYYSYVSCDSFDSSTGACQLKVADYTGKTLTQSQTQSGGSITITYVPSADKETSDSSKANVAYDQSVSAGTYVSSNTTVTVHTYNYVHTHSWGSWTTTTAATCTTGSIQTRKCSVCGVTETQTLNDALGHDYSVKGDTVSPTCTDDGYTVYKCSRCDSTTKKDTVSALGHSYVVDDGGATHSCTRGDLTPESHTYGDDGKCIYCGAEMLAG